jgi:hypothetical protein
MATTKQTRAWRGNKTHQDENKIVNLQRIQNYNDAMGLFIN